MHIGGYKYIGSDMKHTLYLHSINIGFAKVSLYSFICIFHSKSFVSVILNISSYTSFNSFRLYSVIMCKQSASLVSVAVMVILLLGTEVLDAHVNSEEDFTLKGISKNYPTTFGDKNPTEASNLDKSSSLALKL